MRSSATRPRGAGRPVRHRTGRRATGQAASSSTSNSGRPTTPSTTPLTLAATNPTNSLFWLPVTQALAAATRPGSHLIGHSSLRGVTELLADVFDHPPSVGTVHNILHQAVAAASARHRSARPRCRPPRRPRRDLPGRPACAGRRRCRLDLLLPAQFGRAAPRRRYLGRTPAGTERTELPDPTPPSPISPGDCRAGQAEALPDVPCRGDVFHALQTATPWSVTWRIVPTKPSPHAVVWKTARPAEHRQGRKGMRRW